ncbi:MAG: hypothetical protein JWQ08_2185 [Deinococcus sp.]|nr:hypothetical protein [Deinococcus sp.]
MAIRDAEVELRHDEPNLARLNLVLAPNRTDLYEWTKQLALDALGAIHITCTAPRNSLVPHGVDNDILLGLVNAAVLQGLPEDDTVRVTSRELLRLSGITPSARAYEKLRESLRRLQYTAYDVIDSWYDGSKHRWRTMSFSLIVKHSAEDNTADVTNIGQWRAQTVLAIKLDDGVIKNIRAGHILPLNFELLAKLTQPLTRNLFRTLSFQRQGGGQPVLAYSVPLGVWASHLGMHEMRPDTVMRALKPAHEELKATGFLQDVTYQGRGKARVVHYAFGSVDAATPDPEAAALLARYGVSGGRTLLLAQTHGPQAVKRAVGVLEALLRTDYRTKIRNKAGILTDILEQPHKYDTLLTQAEGRQPPVPTAPRGAADSSDPEARVSVRDLAAAHIILMGTYDQPPERREVRDRVSALYVAGQVTTLDLIGLLGKSTAEAQAMLTQWEEQ